MSWIGPPAWCSGRPFACECTYTGGEGGGSGGPKLARKSIRAAQQKSTDSLSGQLGRTQQWRRTGATRMALECVAEQKSGPIFVAADRELTIEAAGWR